MLFSLALIHELVLVLNLDKHVPGRGPEIGDLGLGPFDLAIGLVVLLKRLVLFRAAVRVGPGTGALSVVVCAGFEVVVGAAADGAVVVARAVLGFGVVEWAASASAIPPSGGEASSTWGEAPWRSIIAEGELCVWVASSTSFVSRNSLLSFQKNTNPSS